MSIIASTTGQVENRIIDDTKNYSDNDIELLFSANAEKYLMGLGFKRDDLFRSMKEFSQGWQMRVEIAKLLLAPGIS